jgi:hypothetical protein
VSVDQAQKAPPIRFDDQGHAVAPTEAERRARSEALRRCLAEMVSIPDDPAEPDEEFWRAIDEGRPERPIFASRDLPPARQAC